MPTPRQVTQVAQQVREAPPSDPGVGAWVPGVVVETAAGFSGLYVVALNSGNVVNASSSIDDALAVGAPVWVINPGGSTYLIVGLQ